MTGSGSPCGACKFLRRKCTRACVFAPYFCYEQGASHFAAIHKVFGASNVSKLLSHLPVSDRSEAAVTISYEALARIQDPVYGCISHIFALQQQVVILQAHLASLTEQANQSFYSGSGSMGNPIERTSNHGNINTSEFPHNQNSWFHTDNASMINLLFDHHLNSSKTINRDFMLNSNKYIESYENSALPRGEDVSFSRFEDQCPTYVMDTLPADK